MRTFAGNEQVGAGRDHGVTVGEAGDDGAAVIVARYRDGLQADR